MEGFAQPKITGYRQLNEDETALMNEAKAAGAAFEAVVAKVRDHVKAQRRAANATPTGSLDDHGVNPEEVARLDNAEPERWAAMARTDSQTATMKLCRAIAQPAS